MATNVAKNTHTRFIFEARARIDRCINFGIKDDSRLRCLRRVRDSLYNHWKHYAVETEGYLSSQRRAGILKQPVAWGDQDAMGHVNNVIYNRWAETGRVNWVHNIASKIDPKHRQDWEDLVSPEGIGLILKSIQTDYKFPLRYPDQITVLHRLLQEPKEGMETLLLEAVVLSETHQRIAARITEESAIYDYRIGKKATLPEHMVKALTRVWMEQEIARTRAWTELNNLERRLRRVEQETFGTERTQ